MTEMDICLTESQTKTQQLARKFAEEVLAPAAAQMEAGHFPAQAIREMGRIGLMGIPVPEQYDGAGEDYIAYISAIHEISKVSAAAGVILSVHTSVGTNPILYFGTDAQKDFYLPRLARGDYLGAFALTEPSAGSDAAKLKLRAMPKDDYYLMNGSKMFITNGMEANSFITFARTNSDQGAKGISAFIIDRDVPGLTIGKNERKMGLHGTSTVTLNFDQCKIPQTQLLGAEGQGFSIAMANLNVGRIGIAAQALGIAESAYLFVRDMVKAGGRTDQATLFSLADMATKVEAAKLLVYRAASLIEAERKCLLEVSAAKLFASKAAREVTIDALNLIGQEGYRDSHPLARYFRDAKVTEIYEGTSEIQKIVIAKQLMQSR